MGTFTLEELQDSHEQLIKDLKDLRYSERQKASQLEKSIKQQIENYTEEKNKELKQSLELNDLWHKIEHGTKISAFMEHIVKKCDLFLSKPNHSKDEHDEMISILFLHKETYPYAGLSMHADFVQRAETLLSKIYEENIKNWRKIFGVSKHIAQPLTNFLQSAPRYMQKIIK